MIEQNGAPAPRSEEQDQLFMRLALAEAKAAAEIDEVPVGAVLVHRGEVIATAKNTRECDRCATHHAEICAIEAACRTLGGWRLPECVLYVTLEPCPMCAGAIVNARIDRVVFGAYDPKGGAFGSLLDLREYPLNHKPEVEQGLCEKESLELMGKFFKKLRDKRK